jgi:hypothetical protein
MRRAVRSLLRRAEANRILAPGTLWHDPKR